MLTVNSTSSASMANISDCTFWTGFAAAYGDTFAGATNGCWGSEPYVDIIEFSLAQYDSNRSGAIDSSDFYGGSGGGLK